PRGMTNDRENLLPTCSLSVRSRAKGKHPAISTSIWEDEPPNGLHVNWVTLVTIPSPDCRSAPFVYYARVWTRGPPATLLFELVPGPALDPTVANRSCAPSVTGIT